MKSYISATIALLILLVLSLLIEAAVPSSAIPLANVEPQNILNGKPGFVQSIQPSAAGSVHIYGHVMDLNGAPISQAYMDLYDDNNVRLGNKSSDNKGYYEFSVPWHSLYRVIVSSMAENAGQQIFQFIPVSKEIRPGDATEVRTDITLRSAASLILHVYDSSGNLLRNQAFQTMNGNNVFVTDLDDQPQYGWFSAVNDAYSQSRGGNWNLAVPALAVPLQTPIRFHVLWEVPDFGKVILDLDNEGRGYQVANKDGYLDLNFNYEAAKSELAALRRDFDNTSAHGYSFTADVQNGIQSADVHVHNAETLLAQSSPMANIVSELNLSLRDTLMTNEQLDLQKAGADIERNRKGSVRLQVVDSKGQPIPSATVSFLQTSHDFLFGAQPMGNTANRYLPSYAALMQQAGLNYAYISASWGTLEPSPGIFDWTWVDRDQGASELLSQGFKVLGGLAFWLFRDDASGNSFTPKYQDTMSFSDLQSNVYDHMRALASRYPGSIDLWEFNEQNLPQTNVLNLTWDQKIELTRIAIAGMKAGNPEAKALFNSAALPYDFSIEKLEDPALRAIGISFKDYLDLAASRGIAIDVIGLEFYYTGVDRGGNAHPDLSLASISRLLDQDSAFGKPIYITELSAPSAQIVGSNWWHRPWDDATQAEYLEDFYTIAFSKPLVQEIGWSYGVADNECFIQAGGLLDSAGNPKPAYLALKNLIASWTTTGSGTTDDKGYLKLNGFGGGYDITVTLPGGKIWQTQVHITEQQNTNQTISLPAEYTLTPTPIPIPTQSVSNVRTPAPSRSWFIPVTIGVLIPVVVLCIIYWRRNKLSKKR